MRRDRQGGSCERPEGVCQERSREEDGKADGDIRAQPIIIGQGALTVGNLVAEAVNVRGGVPGSIRGNAVALQSLSRIEADVFHRSLTIEQGAFYEGKSRRLDDPMSRQRADNVFLPTR